MLWDGEMIDDAEGLLRRAGEMSAIGRYQLEAAIQSAHAARRVTGATDWEAIVMLYEGLYKITSLAGCGHQSCRCPGRG